jgi:glycerol-3-phosphate responsive antiterminator
LQKFICLTIAKNAITLIEANKTMSGLISTASKPTVASRVMEMMLIIFRIFIIKTALVEVA